MGGIVGVFTLDGRPVAEADVARMKSATPLPLIQPKTFPSRRLVWFDGRIDNVAELAQSSTPVDVCRSDVELVSDAYDRFGDRFAGRLNGDFALALLDETRCRLVLARDVMATLPLYYCPIPGAVLFASEIKCLVAHPAVNVEIDTDTLAALVLDNWCDVHRTCFNGIYSVPPGGSVTVTSDQIDRRAEWSFDPSAQIRYRSFDGYRDHFKSLFEQAIRRRLRAAEAVAITVSGGLDSSSIFCQASQLQRRESLPVRFHGISMTFPLGNAADEQHLLRELEHKCDARVQRLPVSAYSYIDSVSDAVRCLDTPGAVEATQLRILEDARRAGCTVLFSGFFADQVLADRGYLVDLVRRGRWIKARRDVRELCEWAKDVDPRFVFRDFRSRVVRGLPPRWAIRMAKRALGTRRSSARYPPWFAGPFRQRAHAIAATRFDSARSFVTAHSEQCYRHATAGHYQNVVRCEQAFARSHGLELRYPFRDRDLVAFLMAIPGDIVNWQGVPKGLLRHAMAGVLPDAIRNRRWKADFTALENDAIRREVPSVLRMFTRDCLSAQHGLVDVTSLDRMTSKAAALTDDVSPLPGWRLMDLVGLEFWLRQCFATQVIRN